MKRNGPMRPLSMVSFREAKPTHAFWEESFGPYPWFYVPFAGNILDAAGIRASEAFTRFRRNASRFIPEEWPDRYQWGQWNVISQVQFRSALSHDLVRLDKAILTICIAIMARNVRDKAEVRLDRNDIEQCIIPSVFIVDGIDKIMRDHSAVEELMQATGQRRIVFEEILRGYSVAEYIAKDIVSACRKMGEARADFRLLKDRRDGVHGRLVRPVAGQQLNRNRIERIWML